jgi:hypothetical protein
MDPTVKFCRRLQAVGLFCRGVTGRTEEGRKNDGVRPTDVSMQAEHLSRGGAGKLRIRSETGAISVLKKPGISTSRRSSAIAGKIQVAGSLWRRFEYIHVQKTPRDSSAKWDCDHSPDVAFVMFLVSCRLCEVVARVGWAFCPPYRRPAAKAPTDSNSTYWCIHTVMQPPTLVIPPRRSLAFFALLAMVMVALSYFFILALAVACVYLPWLIITNAANFQTLALFLAGVIVAGSMLWSMLHAETNSSLPACPLIEPRIRACLRNSIASQPPCRNLCRVRFI